MVPSSFLIKKEGRQIIRTETSKSKTNATLILKPEVSSEMLVIKNVYTITTRVALRCDKPKRNK